MLDAEVQARIFSLYWNEKKSVRKIAELIGVDRKTVKRVIDRKKVILEKKVSSRQSLVDPYREQIKEMLVKEPTMASTTILHRLREMGYMGGLSILKVFVREMKMKSHKVREAFLRLEFAPGECAQVDWGEFGDVFSDGVKYHCFVMVLCYSRMTYLEFTRSERFEDFIRCHERAFEFFGGIPKECWYDNLATAVTDRYGGVVRFNPRFFSYMGHHSIAPHACNPARGNEKGRVENAIKFIRSHFWSGRKFRDFNDLCVQTILWRDQYLNLREHRVTKRIVRNLFEAEERPVLGAINALKFETDEVLTKVIASDFHFVFETNRYSVPWTLVGMAVTIRINEKTVKVYFHEKYVAGHERSYLKNKVFTNPKHQEGLLARKPGAMSQDESRMAALKRLGDGVREYFDSLRASSRSLRTEMNRLLALSTVYGVDNLNASCLEMLKEGIVGIEKLERYLRVEKVEIKHPEPMKFTREKLNRVISGTSLSAYDDLLIKDEPTKNEGEESNGE